MQKNESGRGVAVFSTSFGFAGVAVSQRGIRKVVLPKKTKSEVRSELRSLSPREGVFPDEADVSASGLLGKAVKSLQRYFSGDPAPKGLPLDLTNYTLFQQAVWRATETIPYGEKRSYAWIAGKIGNPGAARAVGSALGANPVPILVP